jgi:hypothetical protein
LFDRVWNEYESKNNDKYVYQCGLVDWKIISLIVYNTKL